MHTGIIVLDMVCQHLVNSPIQGLIYSSLLYLLQVESILSTLALQAEEGGIKRASVLTIRLIYSKAIADLATDLNQL